MTLRGLTNRRKDETALFLLPDDDDSMAMEAAQPEIAQQKPMDEPNDNDGGVMVDAPETNKNAIEEIIKSSDTIKLLVLSVTSLGAAVSSLIEPLKKDPVTAISLMVAAVSLGMVFYVKFRDTREGR